MTNKMVNKMSREKQIALKAAKQFKNIKITNVIESDGLVHINATEGGERTTRNWFQITAWPGYITITGDYTDYMFKIYGGDMPLNWLYKNRSYHYLAEKEVHNTAISFRIECFVDTVDQIADQMLEFQYDWSDEKIKQFKEDIKSLKSRHPYDSHEAYELLNDADLAGESISDVWEYSCEDLTTQFILVIEAAQIILEQYFEQKEGES